MQTPFSGFIKAVVIEDGVIVDERITENFLTEGGEAHIADQLSDGGEAAMTYMGIGTGSGQDRTSTALNNQLARVVLDSPGTGVQGTSGDDNDVIYTCTFPTGTSGTVTEGGVFNASTGGTMLNYFNFSPPIEKASTQSVVLTVTITCGYS